MATSDDEMQNISMKDDDSATNGEDDSVASQSMGTPAKNSKKRKDGSEGSAKKKQKKIAI
jgi:hypothetical protein